MDKGTNALDVLEGRAYKLQHPWVGIVNRSQADINKNVDMIVARRREKEYFATNPDYSHLASKMGSEYLAKLLSKHLESVIRARIPSITSLINKSIDELESEMDHLGRPIAVDAGAFFSEHWEYVNNDFYITGESYAGHYIPAFASRLHRANKNNEGTRINFKGFAIGNGFTEPTIQYQAYPDYALDMGLIGESDYQRINKLYPECQSLIKSCGPTDLSSCEYALFKCKIIFSSILEIAGDINRYDIRKKCLGIMCYNFSNIEHFLKLKSVQSILGVEKIEFELCSDSVKDALEDDRMQNYEVGIPALLNDGIKLLVYAGEYDLMCNWLGNSRWVRSMKWSGQKDFVSSAEIPFMVDGKKAGVLKSHGALSFLKVHRAGHMVPLDQPKAALEMLKRWMQGKLSEIPYNN